MPSSIENRGISGDKELILGMMVAEGYKNIGKGALRLKIYLSLFIIGIDPRFKNCDFEC